MLENAVFMRFVRINPKNLTFILSMRIYNRPEGNRASKIEYRKQVLS